MLPSGYLIRPCEGGGSILHIVDHVDMDVSFRMIVYSHCSFLHICSTVTTMFSLGMECA